MDTLKSLQVFCSIVEKGSLTKAGEHLGLSLAMTSKHLQHLESHVQAKLLHRNNRKLSLTDIGEQYYAEAVHALDILNEAKTKAYAGTIFPEGKLRLIAPVWFATPYFVELLAEFQRRYPKIELIVDLENRFTDLIEQGYDLALRVVNTPQDNLIVRKLGDIAFYYVASPTFLHQNGRPKHAQDLANFTGVMPNYTQLNTPLTTFNQSNNTQMLAQMAVAGMGVAILPEWLIQIEIDQGKLEKLFDMPFNHVPIFAVYMNRTFLSTKIRLFIDFLAENLLKNGQNDR